jgi:hypothetical protein
MDMHTSASVVEDNYQRLADVLLSADPDTSKVQRLLALDLLPAPPLPRGYAIWSEGLLVEALYARMVWPASTRWRHMGVPMLPTPMNPSCIIIPLSDCGLRRDGGGLLYRSPSYAALGEQDDPHSTCRARCV